MHNKRRFNFKFIVGIPFLFLIIVFGFYVAFEFTLVAEIRESLSDVDTEVPIEYGKTLFETRGCAGCHSLQLGENGLGPSLFGLASRESEEYILNSILNPNEYIVEGFAENIMPVYGDILNDQQVDALLVFLATLK